MPATQRKVGKDYYVFTKGNPTKCVIDSHGIHYGAKYIDAVHQIIKGEVTDTEHFGQDQPCPDYLLSKQLKSATKTKSHRYDTVGYDEVSDYVTRRVPGDWAVASVRNLSEAVPLLAKDGFQHVHCCFCRGGVWDGVKDMLGKKTRNENPGGTRYTG